MFVTLLRAITPQDKETPPPKDYKTFITYSKNPYKVCQEQNRAPGFNGGSKQTRGQAGNWQVELSVPVDGDFKGMVERCRHVHGKKGFYEGRMVWIYKNAHTFCKDGGDNLLFYVRDVDALREMLASDQQ